MSPELGQRWRYLDKELDLIIEVVQSKYTSSKITGKIVQVIKSSGRPFNVGEKTSLSGIDNIGPDCYEWILLKGQDKSQ